VSKGNPAGEIKGSAQKQKLRDSSGTQEKVYSSDGKPMNLTRIILDMIIIIIESSIHVVRLNCTHIQIPLKIPKEIFSP